MHAHFPRIVSKLTKLKLATSMQDTHSHFIQILLKYLKVFPPNKCTHYYKIEECKTQVKLNDCVNPYRGQWRTLQTEISICRCTPFSAYLGHIYKPRCMIELVNHSSANDYRNHEKEKLHSSIPFVSMC